MCLCFIYCLCLMRNLKLECWAPINHVWRNCKFHKSSSGGSVCFCCSDFICYLMSDLLISHKCIDFVFTYIFFLFFFFLFHFNFSMFILFYFFLVFFSFILIYFYFVFPFIHFSIYLLLLLFIANICYLDLSKDFSRGFSIFYLDLPSRVCF